MVLGDGHAGRARRLPRAVRRDEKHGYDGWIGVEHDKANIDGGATPRRPRSRCGSSGTSSAASSRRRPRPPSDWSYAINQWKREHDGFTRREYHERAFKTIAASGFGEIELRAGSGRWEPHGRRELIEANYGSIAEFRRFLSSCGIRAVSSWFYDPAIPFQEESSRPRSATARDDHAEIAESTRRFAEALAELGGSRLVVRPIGSAWRLAAEGVHLDDAIATAAACWNLVGSATAEHGVRTTVHVDCLSALQSTSDLARFLELTDPGLVGLTLDTAEVAIGGLDPVQLYEQHHSRVDHVHLKNAHEVDTVGERIKPFAEREFLSAGGERAIARWFQELDTGRGVVDLTAVMRSLVAHGYQGTIVIESDQSPDPAGSVMANGWYVQNVLSRVSAESGR